MLFCFISFIERVKCIKLKKKKEKKKKEDLKPDQMGKKKKSGVTD